MAPDGPAGCGGSAHREEMAKMLVPKIILAVAALNLLFLFSELTLNVVRAYIG
jgi:hypothetical protein